MRLDPFLKTLTRRRTRPVDFKRSLISRIAIVAISCFALVTALALTGAEREARRHAEATADLVAKHLDLQLLRINAGFDASSRFPDWDPVLSNNPASGQCVRLDNDRGEMVRSHCFGSGSLDGAPRWFSAVWSALISPVGPAERAVSYKGTRYGTILVSSDPRAVIGHSWRDMQQLLALTGLTILSLCVVVYVAVAKALAPTRQVIEGLNKLSAGDFAHRLPHFRLSELQRISEVANELARKIETTLSERAELSKRLMNVQEEERRRLARELHDEFGQNLTAIAALATSIATAAAPDRRDLIVEAQTVSQIARDMMLALRGTLLHLRPTDLDRFGLTESLRQLVDVWSASYRDKTRFELDVPQEVPTLTDTAAIHIFRIAQEGLTNAAKHADARNVRLRVEPVSLAQPRRPGAVGIRLTIEDDGRGRRTNGKLGGNGMGLLNMQERVAALDGSIVFDDRAGAGLTVRVVVPVDSGER